MTSLSGLRGQQIIEASPEATAQRAARDLTAFARHRLATAGRVHWALSGGSSPERLYQLLAHAPDYGREDWARTDLWQVDERCVAEDDPRLNFAMIRAALVNDVSLPRQRVHPMPVDRADGAEIYERDLRNALAASEARLDIAILGMGPDGHTASLFPRSPALAERGRWVTLNDGEHVALPRPRMTLTYPVIGSARLIAVLVTGSPKHATLRQAANEPTNARDYPIVGIAPGSDTQLIWYLDRAAAEGS